MNGRHSGNDRASAVEGGAPWPWHRRSRELQRVRGARERADCCSDPNLRPAGVSQDAQGGEGLPLRSAVVAAARRLNVGERDSAVAAAVGRLTGQADLDRLSYFAFLDLFGVGERGVLVLRRRWCPECWRVDGEEPYERKVWWLALVDVCHVHECLLESRCSTCGRLQPTLPRAVRIQVCSYCGHNLYSAGVVPGEGPVAERMLWYSREGTRLVHAGEAIALTGSDESESLTRAYGRLAELAQKRDLPAVERFFSDEIQRATGSKVGSSDERPVAPAGERPGAVFAPCAGDAGRALSSLAPAVFGLAACLRSADLGQKLAYSRP